MSKVHNPWNFDPSVFESLQNDAKAAHYYQLAADQGYEPAIAKLEHQSSSSS